MQDLFPLFLAAFFVYLLFFRKGGMGMGCCGGHGGRNAEPVKSMHYDELSEDSKGDVIDLRKDQYTVMTIEEDKHPSTLERTDS